MPDGKYKPEAGNNLLVALRQIKELGNPSISIHGLTCLCSLRVDRRRPSYDDVMVCLQPLLDSGKVKERFFKGQFYRHFYIAE
jgi:hypothetical protein